MAITDNDVLAKIKELYTQKGWSVYRLAKESGVPYSSLNNIILRNTQPSIPTLRKLCHGLGISLSDFFDDDISTDELKYALRLSEDEMNMIVKYRSMNKFEKALVNAYILGLKKQIH